MSAVSKVAQMLLTHYPRYYETVYMGFIEEAIVNSMADNNNKPYASLDALHQHIIENYI